MSCLKGRCLRRFLRAGLVAALVLVLPNGVAGEIQAQSAPSVPDDGTVLRDWVKAATETNDEQRRAWQGWFDAVDRDPLARDAARRVIRAAVDPLRTDPEAWLRGSEALVAVGDPIGAEQLLLDGLHLHPQHEATYIALLEMYEPTDGERSLLPSSDMRSMRLCLRMLRDAPNTRIGRLTRAIWSRESNRAGEAETLLVAMLNEWPGDADVLNELLDLYQGQNRIDEANAAVNRAMEINPEDAATLSVVANYLRNQGRNEEAEALTERRLQGLDDPVARAAEYGMFLTLRGRFVEAFELMDPRLEEALAELPEVSSADYLNTWTSAAIGAEQMQQGIQRLETLNRDWPEASDFRDVALQAQTALLIASSRWPEARQLLAESVAASPNDPVALNRLGYQMVMRHEDPEAALELLQRALEGDPNNPSIRDSVGWALYKLGRFDEAMPYLRRAEANLPSAVVTMHLGDLFYRLKRDGSARSTWRNAIRRIDETRPSIDPESRGIRDRLDQRLRALSGGGIARVAPTVREGDPGIDVAPADR